MNDIVDEVHELFESGIAAADSAANQNGFRPDEQPKHFSWITLDAELKEYCVDASSAITYRNTHEMKNELLILVENAMNETLLHKIRTGEILNLTLRIGPRALSGFEYNEEHGFSQFRYAASEDK